MTGSKTNIFLTGPTGYIGGTVLRRLLDHPSADTFNITVLVRSEQKAAKLKTLGVEVVLGSFSDHNKLENLASEADVVFSIGDADDLNATKALLAGSKKRHEKTGTAPIFIHTSGTGVFAGLERYETFYDDANVEQMAAIPITQMHRIVDLEIVNADKEGYVKTYLVIPSDIYGLASGPLVDMGIQNRHSIKMPYIIRACIDRGQAGLIGDGQNKWPCVDIEEIADLYIVLFDAIVSDPSTGHGTNGYYVGENGEFTLYEVCKAAAEALADLGKSKTAELDAFSLEECVKYFGGPQLAASTSRAKSNHSRTIGWKPTKTPKDFMASMKCEVEALKDSKPIPIPDSVLELLKV